MTESSPEEKVSGAGLSKPLFCHLTPSPTTSYRSALPSGAVNMCITEGMPKMYIVKMIAEYERIFGRKPKPASSPLTKGDHPEWDDTKELDLAGVSIYQSLI